MFNMKIVRISLAPLLSIGMAAVSANASSDVTNVLNITNDPLFSDPEKEAQSPEPLDEAELEQASQDQSLDSDVAEELIKNSTDQNKVNRVLCRS